MRAPGALHAAKYKELPRIRVNRIKGLEADKRKQEKNKATAQKWLKLWSDENMTLEQARNISGYCHLSLVKGEHGYWSAWDVLQPDEERYTTCPSMTLEQVQEAAKRIYPRSIAYADRWIKHLENRLLYEKAMLDEQGASDLLKPAPRQQQLPLCNYRAPEGFIMIENQYTRGEMIKYPQVDTTKAEYAKIYTDYKGTRTVENTHRVRIAIKGHEWFTVFITDSKVHVKPEPIKDKPKTVTQKAANPEADLREMWTRQGVSEERQNEIIADTTAKAQAGAQVGPWTIPTEDKDAQFHAMKDTLKEGIKTVVVPQLFPTPAPIADRMVDLAEIEAGQAVIDPSAGSGAIIDAIRRSMAEGKSGRCAITAVEINRYLCERLINIDCLGEGFVRCGDFLEQNGNLGTFDRIIMNPPFENAVDIKHIKHALTMLKPKGRLVALCANGPRQREAFMDKAEYWEVLPAGSFKEQGTGVNVALLIITKEG